MAGEYVWNPLGDAEAVLALMAKVTPRLHPG